MHRFVKAFVLCAALSALPFAAAAAPLTVVNVGAPAINCVFNVSCTVTVTDSVGNFTPPTDSGNARLQSRTYPGLAPAPAAGDMAYVYRVDLTAVQGITAVNCVSKLAVDFGKVVSLHYKPGSKALYQVFVVTSGGLGSVGLSGANQAGGTITFTFSSPVCPGQTSYFFGLASASTTPKPGVATLTYTLPGPGGTTADRVPGP